MSEINQQEFDELTNRYRKLIASQKTLLLSTSSTDGVPNISYAPFVHDDTGLYYIYVSELASHTVDLLNNPKASIMFICPESESHNLFARERAVLNCSVKEIIRNTEAYTQRIQALQEKFGKVVSVLCTLPDFHLFELRQESGRYVAGFGQAFAIDVDNDCLKR
jgi:putative heme iron utilization protein